VVDALDDTRASSPPNSPQEKSKISSQSEKTNKAASKQFKFKESTQVKLKQNVKTKADQNQVNK